MKNKIPAIITLSTICLILLLSGCASTAKPAYAYDSGLPEEESAVLLINKGLRIKEINCITVDLNPNFRRHTTILIPAGEAQLIFDLSYQVNLSQTFSVHFRNKDIKFNYNFDPGKEYLLNFSVQSPGGFFSARTILIMGLYEGLKANRDKLIESWEVGEYP